MNKVHKPRVDTETYEALKLRAAYIKQRTGQHITVGQTIRWLATLKLNVKDTPLNQPLNGDPN